MNADEALAAHGFDGARLMRLAHRVAHDWLTRHGATVGDKREDLVSFLVVHGCRAAVRFDTTRNHSTYGSNGGDAFASYIADIMEHRCTDWYRSKAEGFGDSRYNNHNRLVLTPMDDDPEPVDFEQLVSDRQLAKYLQRWQQAANATNLDLGDWVIITLNRAAKQVLTPTQIAA